MGYIFIPFQIRILYNWRMKLNARELRDLPDTDVNEAQTPISRNHIYLIVENVYDTYNIGGLFRLADALAVEKLYLCGQTDIPPNHKITKASIGTYKVTPWVYKPTAREAIEELRRMPDMKVYAVEQSERSVPYTKPKYKAPLALVVGNETFGVLPETMELCDDTVEIPMWGINKSLNVIVSAAIVSYFALQTALENNQE